jgi:hypothetical protein
MKKLTSTERAGTAKRASDELRNEYHVDYTNSRPNPYATAMSGDVIAVVLDSDVAEVFRSADDVNNVLRSLITTFPATRRARKTGTRRKPATSPRTSARASGR